MKDVLLYILQNITTNSEDVSIEESDEEGVKHFTITTHPDDVGRVIGREGKIIKAIRSIMRVVAIQQNERVRVSIVSENEQVGETDDQEITQEVTDKPESTEQTEPKPTTTEPEQEETPLPEDQDPPQEGETLDLEI